LADRWSLPSAEIAALPGGMSSHVWAVTAGGRRFVAKAVEAGDGEHFGRGLAAAVRVQAAGLPAGAPVASADGSIVVRAGG
jgi:homoserine kinase type II